MSLERIRRRARAVTEMQAPSVADILRKRGFNYEAERLDELTQAVNDYEKTRQEKEMEKERGGALSQNI